jgi:hypothetical protein
MQKGAIAGAGRLQGSCEVFLAVLASDICFALQEHHLTSWAHLTLAS